MSTKIDPSPAYSEIATESWQQASALLSDLAIGDKYIFRGQPDSNFQLRTSVSRQLRLLPKGKAPRFLIPHHLKNFREAIRGRLDLPDRYLQSDEEVWAIGQHFGLVTPLLDWTESPYVAAYFAFWENKSLPASDDNHLCAVYALNRELVEDHFSRELDRRLYMLGDQLVGELDAVLPLVKPTRDTTPLYIDAVLQILDHEVSVAGTTYGKCKFITDSALEDSVRIIRPKSGANKRLINQKGLFTYSYSELSLEAWTIANFREANEKVMIKIYVPIKARDAALDALHAMNINDATLFPDLDGAARYCNSLLPKLGKKALAGDGDY